jgi:hypothetical protein
MALTNTAFEQAKVDLFNKYQRTRYHIIMSDIHSTEMDIEIQRLEEWYAAEKAKLDDTNTSHISSVS